MGNILEDFRNLAPIIFKDLEDKYGYIFEEVKVNRIDSRDWSIHIIYINKKLDLKIILKQEPFNTDYGFSFFIYKIGTEERNILCNVEQNLQDKENKFLYKAYEDLFTTNETLDINSGKIWKKLGSIPFLRN